jgi:hypothetical protein
MVRLYFPHYVGEVNDFALPAVVPSPLPLRIRPDTGSGAGQFRCFCPPFLWGKAVPPIDHLCHDGLYFPHDGGG